MPNPQIQNDPIYTLPFLYKSGLVISNDATTPNTILNVGAGQCRDSNDVIDIVVGSANLEGSTISAPLVLNTGVNGLNGLDTGALVASTMYAVYIIADSRYYKPTGVILTLASNSVPLLPLGYDSIRLIGYWATDASVHFFKGYYSTSGSTLYFTYDAPQATSVTAGNATSYTGVALTTLVPPVNNSMVVIQSNYTANAAADVLNLQGFNSTGDAITIIAQVAGGTAHLESYSNVLAQLNSAAPSIKYKVSSGSDAVALNVAAFTVSV